METISQALKSKNVVLLLYSWNYNDIDDLSIQSLFYCEEVF